MMTEYVATLSLMAWGLAAAGPVPSFHAFFEGTTNVATAVGELSLSLEQPHQFRAFCVKTGEE